MGRLSNTDKSSRSGNLDPKSEIDDLSLPYDPVLCGTGLNSSRTGIVKFSSSATIVSGLSLHIEKHSQTLSGRYDRIIPTFSENEILLSGRPDFLTLQQVTPSNVVLLTRVIDEFEDEKTDNDVRELQSWKWRQISFPRCWGVAKLDTDSFIYVTETRKKGEIKLAVTHRNMEIDPDEKWCWEDSSSLVIQPSREVLESLVPHSPFTKMLRSLCDEITLGCFDNVENATKLQVLAEVVQQIKGDTLRAVVPKMFTLWREQRIAAFVSAQQVRCFSISPKDEIEECARYDLPAPAVALQASQRDIIAACFNHDTQRLDFISLPSGLPRGHVTLRFDVAPKYQGDSRPLYNPKIKRLLISPSGNKALVVISWGHDPSIVLDFHEEPSCGLLYSLPEQLPAEQELDPPSLIHIQHEVTDQNVTLSHDGQRVAWTQRSYEEEGEGEGEPASERTAIYFADASLGESMDDSIPNNTDLAIAERDIFGKDPKDFLLLDSFDQLTSATLGTAETQQLARGLSFAADGSLWFCQETEASAKSKSSAGAHFILMRYLSQELWNTESAAWEAADPTTQGAKRERTNMEDRAEE